MSADTSTEQVSAPQIHSFEGRDQVVRGTEIELRWSLGGGKPDQVLLNGEKVTGNSRKVKPAGDPTVYKLVASNRAGKAVAEKWVGTNLPGECVSSFIAIYPALDLANDHPYRADHLDKGEIARIKMNLQLLAAGLPKATGMAIKYDQSELNARLAKIRQGHLPADVLKLVNAEFDRERAKVVWPHLGVLAHGGEIQENHVFRAGNATAAEIARVRKNIAGLSAGLAKLPGFAAADLADLDRRIKNVAPGGNPVETLRKINAEFDRTRAALLGVRASRNPSGPHPYRAASAKPAEVDRVRKNLALLSAGLSKITGIAEAFDAAKLEQAVKGMEKKASDAHTLDMINHEFDTVSTAVITRHASKLHHGAGQGSQVVQKGHPFRAGSIDAAELARVKKNILGLANVMRNIPGFGGRFDQAEHERRMKNVKPGATPAETLARFNAEFDWERNNILQSQQTPPPRPQLKPAAPPAPVPNNHPFRADHLDKGEIARVMSNLQALAVGLPKISGIAMKYDPSELKARLAKIKKGHTAADFLKLVNAEFDRERAKVMWPHLGVLAHGGEIQENHIYRAGSLAAAEIARVRANLAKLSNGLAKVPGFAAADLAALDKRIKSIPAGAKGDAALDALNAEFDRVRAAVLQVRANKNSKGPHPYRASSTAAAEVDRVRKNLALLSSGLSKVTGVPEAFDAAKLENAVKGMAKKATDAHTLDMINHEFDQASTAIIVRHASKLHHGGGKGSQVVKAGHPYRAASTDPAEIARVRKNIANLALNLKSIPGFGARFDPAEHDRRMKSIKPGATPAETLARINAEFDWERHNMLQSHATPPARPPLQPAKGGANSPARAA